jgi:hypothetical protein
MFISPNFGDLLKMASSSKDAEADIVRYWGRLPPGRIRIG